MRKKKKQKALIPILIFILGIGILLYPTVSNYYNVLHQSNAIMEYADDLSAMDNETIQQLWAEAAAHNENLYRAQLGEDLPEDALKNYEEILRVSENGMMGYIDIPKIKVHLPVYHGTSAETLQKGIGHLEWTSFPIGGENTHTVLTGHTGLPSARLFTDLEKLETGDTFILQTVGEILTYQIHEISVVLPHDTKSLAISAGKDLCTLVTCTPYGVNSHRLLVHGHRIENAPDTENMLKSTEKSAETDARSGMLRMILIAAGCVLVLLVILFWGVKKKKEEKKQDGPH